MAKIHRNDMPVQHPTQTITLPKEPEPAAPKATAPQFYDQDKDADYEAPHPAKGKGSAAKAGKAKSKKDLAYTIAMVVFAAIFLVSGGLLVKRFFDDKKTENEFSDLQSMIDTSATPEPAAAGENVNPNGAKFAALKDKNADFIGWISIDGTNIDYPVMQTVDNPNYYLKHSFEKQYSDYGVPYVQENCDLGLSDNCVIYGHHMNNGSMFADLCKYADEDFYRQHKTIRFDTLSDFGEYEIVAAFKTAAYSEQGFKYYHFVNADSAEDFDAYIAKCKELALYDTGVSAEYGDKLITLSTCEYSRQNGRMVVVAKQVIPPAVEVDGDET